METKSRRRAEGSRPSDLLTSCLHFSRLSRSKRPTSVPGGTMRTFPASSGYSDRNFSFVIVETARKRRHRGFRARLSSTRLVARSKRLIRFFLTSRTQRRWGMPCMVKRSASKMRSWVWMRSTPSFAMARLANQAKLGVVSERGKRMMGTRWKVMPVPSSRQRLANTWTS